MTPDKQKRDVENARVRRAERRKARAQAWEAAEREAREAREGVSVAARSPVTYLPAPSPSTLLDRHIARLEAYLGLLEFDPSVSLPEKCRIFASALPALCKGVEKTEIRERLEALEARARDRSRWGS